MDALTSHEPGHIGPYRLLGRLGAGGMGRVYLARSEGGRTVAVKVVQAELAEEPEFRARFAREVEAARSVGGEWTAPVLDADTEAPTPWVATGYVPGPDLQTVVGTDHGPLPPDSVRVLAGGLVRALRAIHDAGLVHRDLKPSNVLVTVDGPRVIDFGIARALDTVADGVRTRTGAIVGSPGYMSPEQVRGLPVGPASDVFCLGSVLAYAATGRAPFGTPDSGLHALLFRVAEEEPDLTGLPEPLLPLVRDCLAKDAGQRPTVDALLDRTELPADLSAPWLPAAVLHNLGRHTARLLDADAAPAPAADAAPAPAAGTAPGAPAATPPVAPPTAPPGTTVGVPQPPSPAPGFGPPPPAAPDAPAPGRRRPKWVTPLAAAVGVVVLAGGTLLAVNLGNDKDPGGDSGGTSAGSGKGAGTDTGTGSPSASPSVGDSPVPPATGATTDPDAMPKASDIPDKYFGAWYGPIRKGERAGAVQRVEIIKGGGDHPVLAHLSTYTKDQRLCVQTAYVTSAERQLSIGLPAGKATETTAGATSAACGSAKGMALQAGGDSSMRWAAADGEAGMLRATEGGAEALPENYPGTWRTNAEHDGKKVPVELTLKQGRAGQALARFSSESGGRSCVAEARFFLLDRNALIFGPAAVTKSAPKNDCAPYPAFGVQVKEDAPGKLALRTSESDGEEQVFDRVE